MTFIVLNVPLKGGLVGFNKTTQTSESNSLVKMYYGYEEIPAQSMRKMKIQRNAIGLIIQWYMVLITYVTICDSAAFIGTRDLGGDSDPRATTTSFCIVPSS